LGGGEFVAFQIGCEAATTIDYQCMQGVRQEALVLPEVQAEISADRLDFIQAAGEEMPGLGSAFQVAA